MKNQENNDNDNDNNDGLLKGIVEINETYIGGKAENMHLSKKD